MSVSNIMPQPRRVGESIRVTGTAMSARPRWTSLIAALGLLAAPLLAACGGSGSHHQTTVDLKRRRLARRRDQVTWGATFTGSLGHSDSCSLRAKALTTKTWARQ
jgi:hypothetical protein